MTTLPKSLCNSALVAFFRRVLIITTPGMTNLPMNSATDVAKFGRVLKALIITTPGMTNLPMYFAPDVAMLARVLKAVLNFSEKRPPWLPHAAPL